MLVSITSRLRKEIVEITDEGHRVDAVKHVYDTTGLTVPISKMLVDQVIIDSQQELEYPFGVKVETPDGKSSYHYVIND